MKTLNILVEPNAKIFSEVVDYWNVSAGLTQFLDYQKNVEHAKMER